MGRDEGRSLTRDLEGVGVSRPGAGSPNGPDVLGGGDGPSCGAGEECVGDRGPPNCEMNDSTIVTGQRSAFIARFYKNSLENVNPMIFTHLVNAP